MKKLFFAAVLLASATLLQAQSNNVVSAIRYFEDYKRSKDLASLEKAKARIDTACKHEKTSGEAKTWLYKGNIYKSFFDYRMAQEREKLKDETSQQQKELEAYRNVNIAELTEARNAYQKAKELDTKKIYTDDASLHLQECSRHFENKGIALSISKNYEESLQMFEKALEINSARGMVDTINIHNASLVSANGKMYDKAKTYLHKLIDLKYGKGATYARLAEIHLALKDNAGAAEVVKKGREAHPEDVPLLLTDINLALAANNQVQALENLKLAIEKQPDNANLFLVAGNVYDNMANPKDEKGNELAKPKNAEELLKNAEHNYKKAIELKPDYFDAIYNLGILYNNKGAAINKKADTIMDQAKYAAENKKADAEFKKALEYLEKAHQVDPKERNTMLALKQIYARLQMNDKLNQITEKMNN